MKIYQWKYLVNLTLVALRLTPLHPPLFLPSPSTTAHSSSPTSSPLVRWLNHVNSSLLRNPFMSKSHISKISSKASLQHSNTINILSNYILQRLTPRLVTSSCIAGIVYYFPTPFCPVHCIILSQPSKQHFASIYTYSYAIFPVQITTI